MARVTDSKTGLTTHFTYDPIGRLISRYQTGANMGQSMSYRYDSMGRVEKVSEYYSGSSTKSTTYTYDGKGRVYQVANGTSTEYYAYDMFDRLDETYTYHGDQLVLRKNVGYEMVDERKTSHRLISWAYTALGGYINTYNFDYDQNGNITEIRDKNFDTSYEYDSANQLIRENNQRAGKTWTWEYDEAGNITCKKEYEYTTAEELVTALDEITYLYGNESWGDLLTSYDGRTITYDTIGNPLSDGIWDYTWEQGRRLTRMQSSSATWNYTYDTSGLRTGRTNGTTTYRYWYNDSGLLLRMEKGGTVYSFTYDPAGRPVSVTEGNTRYYYVLNQQGDVIGLLNSNAEMIVMYVYDAWGRVLASVDISASGIGTNNPLRYRGYVYDTETGLYYLQSRYYNPTWGRFISADNVLPDVGGNVQEYNLFVYCWNNPVNYSDQNGNWPSWITKVIIGAAVITAAAILTVATAGTGTTLACFAVGALKGATVGAAMGAFSGAATGAITHRITTGSWEGAGRAALEGAADGFMSGAITGFITGGLTSDVCFVAGTSVLASTGYVAIETVKAGDYVWASNPETGEVALKQVVRSFVNEATELIHVTVKGEEIVCSGGCGIHYYRPHKVWPP